MYRFRRKSCNFWSDFRKKLGLCIVFISHDLRVIHYLADRVYVLYKGEVVEHGSADAVFNTPAHDYTRHLLQAIPGRLRELAASGEERPSALEKQ